MRPVSSVTYRCSMLMTGQGRSGSEDGETSQAAHEAPSWRKRGSDGNIRPVFGVGVGDHGDHSSAHSAYAPVAVPARFWTRVHFEQFATQHPHHGSSPRAGSDRCRAAATRAYRRLSTASGGSWRVRALPWPPWTSRCLYGIVRETIVWSRGDRLVRCLGWGLRA
jgi:hypothetical protein